MAQDAISVEITIQMKRTTQKSHSFKWMLTLANKTFQWTEKTAFYIISNKVRCNPVFQSKQFEGIVDGKDDKPS
jgi:hypothetical protein